MYLLVSMKKIIIFSFCLALFMSCNRSEPNLCFPSSEILLRDLKAGTDEKISFQIENRGNKPLEIQNVNSSCKCIDIDFPKSKIDINKKATISMTYKADEIGQHTESIVIISNDPKTYKLIKISVNVVE